MGIGCWEGTSRWHLAEAGMEVCRSQAVLQACQGSHADHLDLQIVAPAEVDSRKEDTEAASAGEATADLEAFVVAAVAAAVVGKAAETEAAQTTYNVNQNAVTSDMAET